MPAPATDEPRKPPIRRSLLEDVQKQVVRDLYDAVDACKDRDSRFTTYNAQLRGDPLWHGIRPRWKGASDVEDNITALILFGQIATDLFYLAHTQRYMVLPMGDEDEDAASSVEAWFNDLAAKHGFAADLGYGIAYNRARHSYSIVYCGWRQLLAQKWETRYKDKATGAVVEEAVKEQDPEGDYETVEDGWEEVEDEGLEFRVLDTSDFGLDPPFAQSIQTAERCWERDKVGAQDLLDGVDDLGYDAAAVGRVLTQREGRRRANSNTVERNEAEGLGNVGLFEVYYVWGRPPAMLDADGKSRLTRQERRRDYLWVVCDQEVIAFRRMPFRKRPYALFPYLPEPGRMQGDGVTSLVQGHHRSATIAKRFRDDCRDLYMSGTLLVPADEYDTLQRFRQYPGALLPYDAAKHKATDIQPLLTDKSGYTAAIRDEADERLQAQQLFSTGARQQVSEGEALTAREVGNISAGYDEKTDLTLVGLNIGFQELAELMWSHYQQFSAKGASGYIGGKTVEITPEMLQKRFRIEANGQSQDADPKQRIDKARFVYQTLMENPLIQQQAMRGDMSGVWVLTDHVLRAVGFRDPQVFSTIGRKPSPPPSADLILQQLAAAIQQYAAAGDQTAVALLTMLQQMWASAQQQAAQQGAQGPQGPGLKPSVSVNYRDMASNDQAALMQMMGLPAPSGQRPPGQQGPPQGQPGNGTGRPPQRQMALPGGR